MNDNNRERGNIENHFKYSKEERSEKRFKKHRKSYQIFKRGSIIKESQETSKIT
jgi:hypothetical protein